MTLELIKGAALLLSLCLLQSFNVRLWSDRPRLGQVSSGVIFGSIAAIGMMLPIELAPGVIFDPRSVIVSMAALFGGPLTGGIAAAIAGGYRLYLGGSGAPVGVAVIVCSLLLGLAFHYARKKGWMQVDFLRLLMFGLGLHLVAVALFTLLPAPVVAQVMDNLAVPYVLTFAPATAFVGLLLRDIERRLETEAQLHRREREQSAILDNSPAVIFLKDVRGRFMFVNREFETLFGMTCDDMVGLTDHDFLPREVADQVSANDRWVREHDAPLETEEVMHVQGEDRTYIVNKFPLREDDGGIYAVCGIATDITDRKSADAERMQALRTAERANRAKSEFLATVSHEFRTPLNAILGFSEMLRLPAPAGRDKTAEYAGHIHEAGTHMLTLIDDVLDISAIEAGKRKMIPEPLDLSHLARSCVDGLAPTARTAGVELRLELPATLPPLAADKRSMTQIFHNLLSNGIKFTEKGGAVTVAAEAADGQLTLQVADTGIGIPPENLANITEPFARIDSNPHLAQEGTGLGLSIVKSLVEAHGGRLDIASELGAGTTVTVQLPLVQPPAAGSM